MLSRGFSSIRIPNFTAKIKDIAPFKLPISKFIVKLRFDFMLDIEALKTFEDKYTCLCNLDRIGELLKVDSEDIAKSIISKCVERIGKAEMTTLFLYAGFTAMLTLERLFPGSIDKCEIDTRP